MFRKTTPVILAFLLLTATMGFSVPKHHCNMEAGEMMAMGGNDVCCVEEEAPDCCFNQTEYAHLDVDFISPDGFQLKRLSETDKLFSFGLSNKVNAVEKLEKGFSTSSKFPPQIAHGNSQAWLQTFRI